MGSVELSCSEQCMRYLLFAFNVLFWLIGIALLAVGIWIRVDKDTFDPLLGSQLYKISAYVIIGAGAFILLVGFCGCLGAIRKSIFLLYVYFFLILLVVIIELAGGILAFVFRGDLEDQIETAINDTIRYKYEDPSYAAFKMAIDTAQKEFKCCGRDGPFDWKSAKNFTDYAPSSCCKNSGCSNADRRYSEVGKTIYEEGCVGLLVRWLEKNSLMLGLIAVVMVVIEICGMVFSCCLIQAIKNQ